MPYKTNSDFVPIVGEYNNPKIFGKFVETLGYKTVKQQIESFTPQAGSNVGSEFYDTDSDDPVEDPSLRIRDYDLAEIGAEIVKTEQRLTASARQAARIQEKVDGKSESGTEQTSEEKT